jgi:branched-chain amino acid transport system ATP-binding protein
MSVVLETHSLSKSFGGAKVVSDVDFAISEGETRCVIGPNGAGKSTFFKLLVGEHRPTSGSVHFLGKNLSHVLPHRRVALGMSIKFQVPGVFPNLTVEDHLRLGLLRVTKDPGIDDEISRLLGMFHLEPERCTKAGNLSHGKKQWLEIAMAVSLRPKVLLLDEPVAGMSSEETHRTGELVLQLRQEGLTIMVVEHDMTFVKQIASRVTVLHGGRIFADGPLNEVLERDDVAEIYLGKR